MIFKISKIVSFGLALTLVSSTCSLEASAFDFEWVEVIDSSSSSTATTENESVKYNSENVEEVAKAQADTESVTYLGDLNGDGSINVIDLVSLKNAIISGNAIDNGDLNQDGELNTADILLLKKVAFGIDEPVEAPQTPEVVTGYHFVDGVLYFDDTPYSGTYTNDSNEDVLYQNGYAYTGILNTVGYIDGKTISGWAQAGSNKYYFDSNTHAYVTGVTSIDGTNYYFNSEGVLLTNCVIGQWVVDGNGVAVSSLKSKAQSVLATYGSTPSSIYDNYMRVYHKYKAITDSVSLSFSATNDTVTPQIVNYSPSISSVEATGWACFALYTIDRSSASCYYLAALQDYLFREAGYTSRIVYGTQGSGVHYWNQVLVNGSWLNYDGCNSGRGGKTNAQLSAINANYKWCGYIVPDEDYNGCYYYNTVADYNNNNYTYIVNSVYYK